MKTIISSKRLSEIAAAIRSKSGSTALLRPDQMASAIMSINSGNSGQNINDSSVFNFSNDSKIELNEQIMFDIANAIRIKTRTTKSYKPSEMAEAILSIEGGEPIRNDAYLELTDSQLCWFYSGIPSQKNLIAEASIWLPDASTRMFPFLFGGGTDGEHMSGVFWTEVNALSPICFHSEDGTQFNTVFREGVYRINDNYNVPTECWLNIKGDHTDYTTDSQGVTIHHYVNGIEVGRQLRADGWSHYIPNINDLTIFAANIDKYQASGYDIYGHRLYSKIDNYIDYRMPKGTKMKYLKVWNKTKLLGEFVPAKTASGDACLYNKVTNKFIYKQGYGNISVVGEVEYQE